MKTDLKPCPFCGNENIEKYDGANFYRIGCLKCEVFVTIPASTRYTAEDRAIEKWNRRVND